LVSGRRTAIFPFSSFPPAAALRSPPASSSSPHAAPLIATSAVAAMPSHLRMELLLRS
jgi:hypothetical protein